MWGTVMLLLLLLQLPLHLASNVHIQARVIELPKYCAGLIKGTLQLLQPSTGTAAPIHRRLLPASTLLKAVSASEPHLHPLRCICNSLCSLLVPALSELELHYPDSTTSLQLDYIFAIRLCITQPAILQRRGWCQPPQAVADLGRAARSRVVPLHCWKAHCTCNAMGASFEPLHLKMPFSCRVSWGCHCVAGVVCLSAAQLRNPSTCWFSLTFKGFFWALLAVTSTSWAACIAVAQLHC
jgi:hypothetical protein